MIRRRSMLKAFWFGALAVAALIAMPMAPAGAKTKLVFANASMSRTRALMGARSSPPTIVPRPPGRFAILPLPVRVVVTTGTSFERAY